MPPRVYIGNAAQVSHGKEVADVYQGVGADTVNPTNLTSAAAGWTVGKYDGGFLVPLTGAGVGKAYYITTNTAAVINITGADLTADGVVDTDRFAIYTFGYKPSATATPVGVLLGSFTAPDPDIDPQEYWDMTNGRQRYLSAPGLHKLGGSIEGALQNGHVLALAFGKDACTGTLDVVSVTLGAAVKAGDDRITLNAAGSALQANDYIDIGAAGDKEVRQIASMAADPVVTLVSPPLLRDHANGAAVREVIAPYTHVMTPENDLPPFTIEMVLKNLTNFVRYYQGCKVSEIEITGEPGKALMVNVTYKAKKPVKGTTASTVTLPTTVPFMWNQAAVTFNGVAIGRPTKLSIKQTNDLDELAALQNTPSGDGKYVKDFVPKKLKVTWSMTVAPIDTSIWDALVADSVYTGSVVFTRGATDTLTVQMLGIRIKTAPHNIPEEGAVQVEMVGDGGTTTGGITLTLVDSTPIYI